MGWFLTKKTAKKARRGAAKSKAAARPWDPQKTLRVMRGCGWVLAIGLTVGAWFYGESALQRHLGRTQATMPIVNLVDAPQWMPGPVVDGLRATVAATVDPNPFDGASLEAAAQQLQQSPWIERVYRVHRQPAGRIDIIASYRRPIALIEAADGCHLVDVRGTVLPLVYPPNKARALGLPIIHGVAQAPLRAGEQWPGGDVRAGLRLGLLVSMQSWANQVQAIDVSNYGGRLTAGKAHLSLLTADGAVRWGRAPGDEQFYEPPAATKLAHIDLLIRKFASLTPGRQDVDVSGDTIVTYPRAETATVQYTSQ